MKLKLGALVLLLVSVPVVASAMTTVKPINVGTSKVLVLLYDFKDSPVDGSGRPVRQFTEQQVADTMFGTGAVHAFFREQSYNQLTLTGTVVPWKRLARNASGITGCTYPTREEIQASIDAGRIDLRGYDRIVVVAQQGFSDRRLDCFQTSAVPNATQMSFNNGTYYMAVVFTPRVVDDVYALEHELGHTLQFGAGTAAQHASVLECPAGIVSNSSCSTVESAHHFDLISAPSNPLFALHTNAYYKDLFGWFTRGSLLNITQSGVYSISPIELPASQSSTGVVAAKITLPGQTKPAFYIEYRQPIGIDSRLTDPSKIGGTTETSYPVGDRDPRGNLDGIFVYQNKGTRYPLLDMSPMYGPSASTAQNRIDRDQVALTATHAGVRQYYDAGTGITIGPITSVSPTQISFRVQFASQPPLPTPPDVVAGSLATLSETSFSYNGASATDANGDLARYQWSIRCETACPTITTNASGALSGHYASIPSPTIVSAGGGGAYTLVLTVVDATGRATTQSIAQTLPSAPPFVNSITPTSGIVGGTGVSLTVNGSGFAARSVVNVDGDARPTTYVSPTTLTAVLSANDLASVGPRSITVTTLPPGGGTSNAHAFTVTQAFGYSLSVTRPLTITSGVYGANDYVTVIGSLVSGAPQVVNLSISGLPAGVSGTFDSRSCTPGCEKRLYISATSGAQAGTYTVTVTGTSGVVTRTTSFPLTVQASRPALVPTTVTIAPAVATNAGRGIQQYTATVLDQFGGAMTATPLTWSSSIPTAISISTTGLATILNRATTTITADVVARTANGVTSNVAKFTANSAYDYDNNGRLDPADLRRLRECVLSSIKCLPGKWYDFTGDGRVGAPDVVEFRRLIVVNGPYDYNTDMKLDSLDVNILTQVVASSSTCPTAKVCDVNSDGTVSAADITALTNYVVTLGLATSTGSQIAGVLDALGVEENAEEQATQGFTYVWNTNLEIGSPYYNDVVALQTALVRDGVYTGEVTGGFYTQTYLAVRRFQTKYGINPTGFVGPITRAKLNELY